MSETEIHISQILPGSANQLIGSNAAATQNEYKTLSGTSNQVVVTNGTGTITLATPQDIATSSTPIFASETLSATTNQLTLGTTHITILSATAPSASRTYTIPDAGGAANVLLSGWGQIVNADINSSAAIVYSKLSLTGSIVNADINASAAIAYSKLNLTGSILNADINSSAAIAYSKLAVLTIDSFVYSNASGVITATANPTNGQLLIGSTGAIPAVAALTGTTNNLTVTNGAGTITLSTPLTSAITYTLPASRGSSGSFLQTDGTTAALLWTPGGSGTISTGTSGQNAVYTGTNTIGSGATMSMNSTKITSLANGTASTDAAAFGQIHYTQTPVQATNTGRSTTSSTSFVNTGLAATITPTTSSSKIKITVCGTGNVSSAGGAAAFTISRGSTNLGGSLGFSNMNQGIGADDGPISMVYIDSPATTSSTTYNVQYLLEGSGTASWGDSNITQVIILEEII